MSGAYFSNDFITVQIHCYCYCYGKAIAIEVNPVDSAGSATKKRGIVVRSASELDEFNRIMSNEKLVELARKMDQVNPKQKEAASIGSSDVFEI